jgi:hypothetical protein
VELVALGGDGGVVGGEIDVDVDGVGGFIDDVAGREGDVEAVAPAAGGVKVDGTVRGLSSKGSMSDPTTRGRTSRSEPA